MNLKKLFTTIHIGLIILLLVLSILSLLLFQNKANLKKNNKIQLQSYAIATSLRKSSDNLTRYARTYVLTGDSIWKKKYWDVLDIRNGKKPWPNGRIISLKDSLKKLNFTKLEIEKLTIAEQNSNKLVQTEKIAMNAIDGLFNDGKGNFTVKKTPNIFLARTIIFDKKYHEDKSKIMEPIEDFFVLFQQRIQKKIKKYDTISYWLLGTINTLIILIISISTVSFFIIKNRIIVQFEELKRAKKKVDEKEIENKKLLLATEQSSNTIVLTDTEGNIEYINPKFTELTGYTAEEVLGKNQRILKSGKQSKEYYKYMWNTIKKGNTWKGVFHNRSKNGNLFWEQTTITPIKDSKGKIINFLGIKENITALKESEINLLNAQKIAKMGSFNLDLKTETAVTSSTFDVITGFHLSKSKTFDIWRTITHPEDAPNNQKALEHCIKTGEKFDVEYRILTKGSQKLKWIHGLGEVIFKNGEPTNFVGTIQDITDRKIAEQELIKAKKIAEESSRLKTEFLNNMSHEIRTPMNGILGFSNMLKDPGITEEKRKYFVNIIQNSGNQLLQIIDDILEISRLGTKQVKVVETEVCLNDVLLELFSIFEIKAKEQKNSLYIENELSDRESTIFTDKIKLNKILSNLIENALKFTNQGTVEVGYKLKNKKIEIYIKDTGIGIDKEHQELIFERFSQAEKELSKKVGGLGLGLSIAKENTELLGGKISVQSKKGKGAIFFVSIPYKPVFKDIENEYGKHKKIILIADDEETNYLYLETLLKDKFKTLHAKNGKEAIEICQNNLAIDIVLLDMKMPVVSGFEAAKEIKKLYPNFPIIAQTAYSTKEEKEKAISAGCDDFISKPIDKKILFKTINKNLSISDKGNKK